MSGRTARVEQDSTDRYDRPAATVPLPNALAYGVALMAFVVAAIQPFAVLDKGLSFTEASNGYFLHNAVPFAVLGALILWRRPGHAIGWVLVLIGGLDAFTHIGDEYELFEFGELAGYPSVLSVEQVVGWLWVPVVALVGMALPQLFPDGRLLSRRWRPLAGFCAVATAVLSVLFIMDPTETGWIRCSRSCSRHMGWPCCSVSCPSSPGFAGPVVWSGSSSNGFSTVWP